jgi:NADH oxidase (H2O2-forming)
MFNVHFKTEVKKIIPKENKILADKKYSYDVLVYATGARPFIPFKVENWSNVYELSTDLSDARKIKRIVKKGKSVSIIGAGAIGLELAQSFANNGMKVNLIEHFDRVLPKLIDKDSSVHIENILKDHKIKLYHSHTIKQITGDKKKRIHFDKYYINTDYVVLATGTHAQIALAKDAGIKVNRGVLVDNYMRTNYKNIYAIGDAIEGYDLFLKNRMTVMVANNAIQSAKIAAMNILGKKARYYGSALPFSITVYNHLIQTIGWNEDFLNANKIKYGKVIYEGMTRKPELGGGYVIIKLLYDPKKLTLLGAQIFTKDPEFQELNRLLVIAIKKIPLPEASLMETSYTPTIDMPINALSIAMSMVK